MRRPRCHAQIYVRDTYRRHGGSPGGFRMHYARKQCARAAAGDRLCLQHERLRAAGRFVAELDWYEWMEEGR